VAGAREIVREGESAGEISFSTPVSRQDNRRSTMSELWIPASDPPETTRGILFIDLDGAYYLGYYYRDRFCTC